VITLTILLAAGSLAWAWFKGRPLVDPLQRAQDAYARGDWETAARLVRARLKSAGNDLTALRLLARTTAQLGRDSSAVAMYQRLGTGAMSADDFYLLGLATAREGNYFEAVKVWEQARSANPDHAETLYVLTLVYTAGDQYTKAIETARRLASCSGWDAHAEVLLGTILLNRGDPSGAVTTWQRALSRKADEHRGVAPPNVPRKDLARALLQTRQPAAARSHLQIALAAGPDPEASWLLSRAYLQEGMQTEALAAWEKGSLFREENPLVFEPAPFVGSAACAKCHRTTVHAQQATRHARTFYTGAELGNLALPAPSFPDPAQPAVTHTIERSVDGRLHQETRAEDQVFRAVVEYAVGSGHRGLTFIGRDDHNQARELRLSQYATDTGTCWDVTFLHARHPSEAANYLGQPLWEDGISLCFGCHLTDPQAVLEGRGPLAADRGIGCEKCHGPGGNHELAVKAKFPDLAIAGAGIDSGSTTVQMCAKCHTMPGKPVLPDDPKSIRFQGATLTWSRCFTESKDTLDCVTCHDPHRDVDTSTAYYEAKCLSCHGAAARSDRSAAQTGRDSPSEASHLTPCPVNPTNGCIACHMPKRNDVVPHSSFTDHFIRVHRD
jgi:tetratricopeptide (TPR) repeat protein